MDTAFIILAAALLAAAALVAFALLRKPRDNGEAAGRLLQAVEVC